MYIGFSVSHHRESAKREFFGGPIYNHELKSEDILADAQCIVALDIANLQVLNRDSSWTSCTVYSKRNAHLIPNFFVAPLGEGGQKFTWSIM